MVAIITPHTKGAGYFRNDDSVSGGKRTEADVQTCSHCQKILQMQIWQKDGAYCGGCDKPICDFCAVKALKDGCVPFVKWLEQAVEAEERRAQYKRIVGV